MALQRSLVGQAGKPAQRPSLGIEQMTTGPLTTIEPDLDSDLDARHGDPTLDGDHERMAHIVLEGFHPEEGDFVSAGPSVVEGIVNGTAVKALCGKIWVPGRNPKKYPVCPTCKEIAESMGWKIPSN